MEIENNLFNKDKNKGLIKIELTEEKITPIVKLIKIDSNYKLYIFLRGLLKKQIKIKYINNFLIINMTLKYPNTNVQKQFKRSFYLKNLDIDNIKITTSNNIISLKVPIIKKS